MSDMIKVESSEVNDDAVDNQNYSSKEFGDIDEESGALESSQDGTFDDRVR